jgi:ABC-type multidrug transport system permease subunit
MFRGLRAVIYKEFIHMRRDPLTVFVALFVPVIQLTIFGYAVDMDVRNIPTVICDQDRSAASRELPGRFENTGYFRILHEVDNPDRLYTSLRSGEAKIGILIPPGFGEHRFSGTPAQVQVLLDGSDITVAQQALNTANAIGLRASLMESAARFGVTDPMSGMPLEILPRLLFNPTMRSANFMVPGLIGILLWIVTVFLTSVAIVREREKGTIEQLFVTPLSRQAFIIGKLVPFAMLGAIEACVIISAARFIFGIPINGSVLLLALLIVPYLLTGLMVGLVISTRAANQGQAMQFSALTMLPSVILSGFMFPRASMPLVIYVMTFFVPLTYFLEIVRGIIIRGAIWADLWDEAAILLVFFVVFMILAVRRFRKQLG